jgi:hypothetical protein
MPRAAARGGSAARRAQGATIHTSSGLYMNVRPRADIAGAPDVAQPEPLVSEPVLNA